MLGGQKCADTDVQSVVRQWLEQQTSIYYGVLCRKVGDADALFAGQRTCDSQIVGSSPGVS